MKNICFCFQFHLPRFFKRYRFFNIGIDHYYYDDMPTEEHVSNLVNRSYLPLCQVLNEMISMSKNKFHCAVAISGITLDLFELYSPSMIDILRSLAKSGSVEFVVVPYSYSLASEYSESEYTLQLQMQKDKVKELFGVTSTTLWNTELMYNDEKTAFAERLGFTTIMTDGAKQLLGGQSCNMLFRSVASKKMSVLTRNIELSDELSFHFSDHSLDAKEYTERLARYPQEDEIFNIWLGAEAFGYRQSAETGIFDFLKMLPYYALQNGIKFATPSEAAKHLSATHVLSSPETITWCGEMKNLGVYNGNDLQHEALQKLFEVADRVHLCKNHTLKYDWLFLQTVNHFQNMNHIDPGYTHYESAYDAFINYMNVLSDFLERVAEEYPITIDNEELNELLTQIANQEKQIKALEGEIKKLRAKK